MPSFFTLITREGRVREGGNLGGWIRRKTARPELVATLKTQNVKSPRPTLQWKEEKQKPGNQKVPVKAAWVPHVWELYG